MGIWLGIVVAWAAYAAGGGVGDVNVPWLITIACWACLDLFWNLAPRGKALPHGGARVPIQSRVLAMIPHMLYCLPLSDVPILGQRLLPRPTSMQWAGAIMCVAGVGFAIYARHVLARSWSGDVTVTDAHTLVQRGPFALVRHPIYLGLITAQLGMIIALGEVRALVFVSGIDRLLKKLPLEEAALRKEYPLEYEQYSRRVRKLVPLVW